MILSILVRIPCQELPFGKAAVGEQGKYRQQIRSPKDGLPFGKATTLK